MLSGIHRQHDILSAWHAATHQAAPAPGAGHAAGHAAAAPVAAAGRATGHGPERAAACGLTPRETAVLALLADTLTAPAIGRRLGISARTVHKHLGNLYRKLGTQDRLGTVLRAQQYGLLPARQPAR